MRRLHLILISSIYLFSLKIKHYFSLLLGKDCSTLIPPVNGGLELPCFKYYQASCKLSCNTGFFAVGPTEQTCMVSRSNTMYWSSSATKCQGISLVTTSTYAYSKCTYMIPVYLISIVLSSNHWFLIRHIFFLYISISLLFSYALPCSTPINPTLSCASLSCKYSVLPCPVLSCPALLYSYLISCDLCFLRWSILQTLCPVLSCPVLSCPALPFPALPCPTLFLFDLL